MASYDQLNNKLWRYRISLGKSPVTGKYKYISKTGFKRKSDAKNAAELVERQMRNGEYIAPSTHSFNYVADEWIKHYSRDAKVSSVRAREKAIYHAKELYRSIQTITKRDYQAFVDDISARFSKNYVDSIVSSTNLIFKYALDMKIIAKLPIEGIKRAKYKTTVEDLEQNSLQQKFLEKDELFEFLSVAKHHHKPLNSFEVFVSLAYLGLRAGELLALKCSNIDYEECTVSITKTYYNPNNNKKNYQILTPKTESSIGKIFIDPNVIKLFQDYKANVQDKWKNELYVDNDFIFTDNNGYPLVIKKL